MSAEERIAQLGLELPPPAKPAGVYKPVVIVGNMLYVSGHGPLKPDGQLYTGKLTTDPGQVERGQRAARQTGLAILSTLRANIPLSHVVRLVKTLGMVNCSPDFKDHPAVMNGFSNLMAEVFGQDAGIGARSAVGLGSLPGDITVEIEAIFEIEPST
jgi:enamine deaminase RidA (YjgF/YER057c/UK114 family)